MGLEYTYTIATADVEADGYDELVITGRAGGTGHLWVLGDGEHGYALLHEREIPGARSLDATGADLDADRMDEIFFGRFFIDDVSASGGSLSTIPHFPGSTSLGLTHFLHETMSGDFDGDGRDDVLIYQDRTGEPMFNEDTGLLLTYQGEGDTARYEERPEVFGPLLSLPSNYILVGANVDDDSMVLTQTVDADGFPTEVSHHQFFRDPVVIAAIAGPPCREEIGQNCNACSTGLGTYNGTTYTGGVSLSVRAGVVVGFLYKEDFSLAYGIGTSWTVAALHHTTEFGLEFAATYSYSFTREETITYNAGCGEDLIVFSSTPVQRFTYTVATLPEDTENHDELVGREMVVDVPLTPRVSAVSREYYNANNGDWPDIGPEVIPNTPGVLETYPNYEEAIAILGMYDEIDYTEAVPIGLGNGFTTRSLRLTRDNFVGLSLSAYLDSTTESCIFGICAGYSVGYGLGGFFEVTFTEGMEFSCSVSHIPEEHFAENYFSYGLFAYTMDLPGADSEHPAPPLTVLNYYIE